MSLTPETIRQTIKDANEEAQADIVKKYGPTQDDHPLCCGFGWVTVKADGRSKIGKMLRKMPEFGGHHIAGRVTCRKSPPVVSATQSMAVKERWAAILAKKLSDIGLDAYAESRID